MRTSTGMLTFLGLLMSLFHLGSLQPGYQYAIAELNQCNGDTIVVQSCPSGVIRGTYVRYVDCYNLNVPQVDCVPGQFNLDHCLYQPSCLIQSQDIRCGRQLYYIYLNCELASVTNPPIVTTTTRFVPFPTTASTTKRTTTTRRPTTTTTLRPTTTTTLRPTTQTVRTSRPPTTKTKSKTPTSKPTTRQTPRATTTKNKKSTTTRSVNAVGGLTASTLDDFKIPIAVGIAGGMGVIIISAVIILIYWRKRKPQEKEVEENPYAEAPYDEAPPTYHETFNNEGLVDNLHNEPNSENYQNDCNSENYQNERNSENNQNARHSEIFQEDHDFANDHHHDDHSNSSHHDSY